MPVRDAAERLWSRVDRSDPEACWLWPGATSQGYGRIKVDGKMCQAHRVSWELIHGPIPSGLQVDHLCRVPRCINPSHLRLVTHAQNMQYRRPSRKNRTGIAGVRRVGKSFQVHIAGEYYGSWPTLEEAAAMAARARPILMPWSDPAKRQEVSDGCS